jgi:hypothetical protein
MEAIDNLYFSDRKVCAILLPLTREQTQTELPNQPTNTKETHYEH